MADYGVPKDPESLGSGIGAALADYIPLLPSGARRAGAARVMAARVGRDPSFLVEHPLRSQLGAIALGAVLAGVGRAQGMGNGATALAALGPLAAAQLLKRRELQGIQEDYDTDKRKRLRELDEDELFDKGFGRGSSRLGAISAYETMRKRKYQGYGSLAEAGDAIQLAAGAVSPALYYGAIPVVSGIDNRAGDKILAKRADFSHQRNSPSIPLYLLAGALSSLGQRGAGKWARHEFGNTPPLAKSEWAGLINSISDTSPMVLSAPGMDNAFYYKPKDRLAAIRFLNQTRGLDNLDPLPAAGTITGTQDNQVARLLRDGVVVGDSRAGRGVIAHEAGHARIENTPGLLRMLQRHVYPHSRWIAPLSGAGSMAAGLASGGALKGALLGTLIGGVSGAGMVGPEIGASYHGLKGLGKGSLTGEPGKDLLAAISTYLAGTVLPSTLAGAAGGYISGRRKKKKREEEEGQEKGAAHEALPKLLEAKRRSDASDYRRKNLLLRQMMEADPEAWEIDSDDGKGIVGLTHTPTNFRLHMPRAQVYPEVLKTYERDHGLPPVSGQPRGEEEVPVAPEKDQPAAVPAHSFETERAT